MTTDKIAPHEALELHELLTFKNVCATKSATMAGLVKDEALKCILQDDVTVSQGQIRELQNLMQKAKWDSNPTNAMSTMNPMDSAVNTTAGFRS
jgi:similar to spore coat protein